MDGDGRLYATIPKLGAVVRLDEHGGYEPIATVPSAELAAAGRVFGLEADRHGNLYVTYVWNYSEEDEEDPGHAHCRDARDTHTGIYRVEIATGRITPVLTRANGWPGCFPDDIAVDANLNLYVTDLTLSGIWKIEPGGRYTLWSADALLQWPPRRTTPFPKGRTISYWTPWGRICMWSPTAIRPSCAFRSVPTAAQARQSSSRGTCRHSMASILMRSAIFT